MFNYVLIGCIENADETAYSEEVQRMVDWCGKNNLVLNVCITFEMTNFRKHKTLSSSKSNYLNF